MGRMPDWATLGLSFPQKLTTNGLGIQGGLSEACRKWVNYVVVTQPVPDNCPFHGDGRGMVANRFGVQEPIPVTNLGDGTFGRGCCRF